MADGLTLDDFSAWIGAECEVTGAAGTVRMKLVAAEPLTGSPREGGGFRLEFDGPREPALEQSIMQVAGPDGRREIFMVPIRAAAGSTRYEAIFF